MSQIEISTGHIFQDFRQYFFFFFQAEDGIRDRLVTGVQTALPIYFVFFSPRNRMPPIVEMIIPSCENENAIASPAFAAASNLKTLPRPHINPTGIFLKTTGSSLILPPAIIQAPIIIPTDIGKITVNVSILT